MKGLFISFGFLIACILIVARAYTGEFGNNLTFGDFLYCFSNLPFDVAEDWADFARIIQEAREFFQLATQGLWYGDDFIDRIGNFFSGIAGLIVTPFKFVQSVITLLFHILVDFQVLVQRLFFFFFGFQPLGV